MTTILLIRHGMTAAVGRRITGWAPGVGLTDEGRRQVEVLGRELRDVSIDAVFASPLERAAMTAQAVAQPHQLEVITRDGLGEVRFGDWTGKTLDELAEDEVWKRWNTVRSLSRAPNGESFLETQRRMMDEINHARQQHPEGTVALVSHADAIRAALVYLLGMPLDLFARLRIDPASVSILRISDWNVEAVGINLGAEGIASRLS